MCLILMALDSHPDYQLIVAANRDEFYERPAELADFWTDAPTVLAGRDLLAGGTWLGITGEGRFAAVTNYRQGHREPAGPRSRGHLVRDFLVGGWSPAEYLRLVEREAAQYNGFNLIAGHRGELWYFSNRQGVPRRLTPAIYGLSNHLLDTTWPKVSLGKSALSALGNERDESSLIDALFEVLSDRSRPPDHRLPRTGVGEKWERLLSSAFIAEDGYGTRSSTVVLFARDGSVAFIERTFGHNGTPGEWRRFRLRLAEAAS